MPLAPTTTGAWSIVNSPSAPSTQANAVNAVTCSSAADCWAVGYGYADGAAFQTLIEHWNGTSWAIVTSPNASGTTQNFLNGVTCTSASDCWAVGYYNNGTRDQTLIERWNGSSWAIVTSPNTGTTDYNNLYGVSCTSASQCWAVGYYYNGGGYARTLIERWNGSSWAIVTSPNTSTTDNNNLYGVSCTSESDCWAVGFGGGALIERWNGSTWAIVTSPNTFGYLNAVTCTSASNCWAVGYYFPSQRTQTLIEHWNGTSWSIIISPNTSSTQSNYLYGMTCASASDCWAVGYYFPENGLPSQTLVEHWNGSSWTIVTSPNSSATSNYLAGVTCSSASGCWAVGHYNDGSNSQTLIERWNGISWSIVTSPNTSGTTKNELFGLICASASECWAVGYYFKSNSAPLIEQWNGTSWTIVSAPQVYRDELHGVACASASECWSAGSWTYFSGAQDYINTLIEQWNGTSWARVDSPNVHLQNSLNGVTCASASDCWAVGYYNVGTHGVGPHQTVIEHWNGTSWSIVTSANAGSAQDNVLNNVKCSSASDCWAVGYYDNGSNSQTLIERWNGTSWSIVTSPNNGSTQNNVLNGLKCLSASNCWAVGYYHNGGGYDQTLIEHWNGTSWSIVTSPNSSSTQNNQLTSVTCPSATQCWGAGSYINGSGYNQTLIESWNGSSWAIVISPNTTSTQNNVLNGVSCGSTSDCWAAGHYLNDNAIQQTLIERWSPTAVQFVSAVSRKTHGSAGAFDINLPLTGSPGIECRTGGGPGNHRLLATFGLPVTMTGASVVSGTGSVSSSTVSGSQITVNLTGVTNAQTILIRLAGVNDGTNSSNFDIPMGVLLGDTTGDAKVNSSDITQTKSASGHTLTASNFREDVMVNGMVDSSDLSVVKSKSGTALP